MCCLSVICLVFLNGSGEVFVREPQKGAPFGGGGGFEMCVAPFGGRAHGSLRGAAIWVYLWLGVAPGGMREGISPLASAGLRRLATHTPKELITQEGNSEYCLCFAFWFYC
jgi:hypothetical protein